MKILFYQFIFILLLNSFAYSQETCQWRGPNRDGFYPESNLLKQWPAEGPELLWRYDSLGIGYTSASVTSERVYITGTIDSLSYLYAFNHNGELIWKKMYGKAWMINFPGVRSTPLINDSRIYLLSGQGIIFCFNESDGSVIWSVDLFSKYDGRVVRFGITENLLINGDKLFCTPGGLEANIIALDRFTGDLIWKSKGIGEESAYCSPQIITHEGKNYLITITAKSILALNPEIGELIWSHDLKYPDGIHGNTPIYHNGYIFAMNGWDYGSVMLKIIDEGNAVEEVWRSPLFDLEHGDVIKFGNNIYGSGYAIKNFSCADWETGVVKDSVKGLSPASIISADSMLYCYSYAGEVALLKPLDNGFEIVSQFKAEGLKRDHIAHPVIKNGRLYLRYAESLFVYNISSK